MFVDLSIRLLRLFLYFLVVFLIGRVLFLVYFYPELQPESFSMLFSSVLHAWPLDVSTACYLLFLAVPLLLVGQLTGSKIYFRLISVYCFAVSVFYFLLVLGEIGVYREMRIKVYYSAFARIFHPSEILTYLDFSTTFSFTVALATGLVLFYFLFRAMAGGYIISKSDLVLTKYIHASGFFFLSIFILVIGSRGGFQPIAINEGEVCFSKNQCANDAAINPLWNLVHSCIETRKAFSGNTYRFMPNPEAENLVKNLYTTEIDSTLYLFNIKRPNICLLILEGWHADLIESLGGYKDIAPNFEKLVSEGYLFTNVESTGHISDQGIAGILSAYPALTFGSVINQNEKQLSIPCLGKSFGEADYYTSFLYGGQLIYGGIKKYIYQNKFNSVTEQKDLSHLPAGKVGVHDSLMFNVWRDSIRSFPRPFFSCYFTLSTHVPYDMPTYYPVTWGGGENRYLNSAAYADRQLGRFFEDVRSMNCYDSTVFILVADHGHHTPSNHTYNSPKHYHIPLLICGGALKNEFRGVRNEQIASQTDIASTLLHQLDLKGDEYIWSKNLMNPKAGQFAFYTFNEGFGFIDTTGSVVWDKKQPMLSTNTAINQESKNKLQQKGEAMLQMLMEDFLDR